jgi:hypothetical protein
MFEAGRPSLDFPETLSRHKTIVAQADGGMIPIVEPDANQKDKRKGKKTSSREAKISLAHAKGSRTPVYVGTIEGGVEIAGRQPFECAVSGRLRRGLPVHAFGDGAPWIVGQVEEQFGAQGSYLIDFYHQCLRVFERRRQGDCVGCRRAEGLDGGAEGRPPEVDEDQAPVQRSHRYLSDRRNQLNYREALTNDLPIGSGRSKARIDTSQQRLKRPGAWCRVKHAEYMLALQNGDWDAYWASLGKNGSPAHAASLNRQVISRKSAA